VACPNPFKVTIKAGTKFVTLAMSVRAEAPTLAQEGDRRPSGKPPIERRLFIKENCF